MVTSERERAVCDASSSVISKLCGLSVMSSKVGVCPAAGSTSISPAVWSKSRARPPFVTSLGIETLSPSLISEMSVIFSE